MQETIEVLVPREGIARFLDERFGPGGAVAVRRLGEGHSNLTFLVSRDDAQWVLRRPPRGDILPGTHEMHREYAVMSALEGAGMPVPVPPQIALCEDASFIGAPFFLMGYVDGVVVRGEVPEPFSTPDQTRRVGLALVDCLADVHAVAWRDIGLETFARKPDEFLVRNLRRMQQLYDMIRHRDVPEIDEAGDWLRATMPQQRDTCLTHGDYKLDNVMFAPDLPARIAAVVDWEISTIGDPLVDVGWMLYFSREPSDPTYGFETASATEAPGYPSRAEMAARYAERTGRDPGDLRFYTALAGWKIAIIMEGSYRRWLEGMADDEMFSALDGAVPALARRSLDVIAGDVPVA